MTSVQEEALYDFLDNASAAFEFYDIYSYVAKADKERSERLNREIADFLHFRKLAFPAEDGRWISRRACFEPLSFVISPTRLELLNGILIPGHRCVPFASSDLLPQEYSFYWKGSVIPFTSSEGPPEDFYPFYSVYGEEYAPQYVARDNDENEEAFNSDPYDDPPEVSIKTLDMRNIYRETSFVPGDRFAAKTLNWKNGEFELEKVGKDEWARADLDAWVDAADKGFEESFGREGPLSCTEEQIAYAYWYGGPRMRRLPAYALEEYLYEKTEKVETTGYGIETRFWFAGREIQDKKELDFSSIRPDVTPVETVLHKVNIPVSEFVIQSYVLDSLYRENGKAEMIKNRLVPGIVTLEGADSALLSDYIAGALKKFRAFYSLFTDKAAGPIRQRAGELHSAVIELAAQLKKGGEKGNIELSWLPRHSFIILSQIQTHTASMLEDLDSDEPPREEELEALDNSLDSMIETFDDIKELINEALNSYRRNRFSVIRPGTNSKTVNERLLQISIGGIDIWRRVIVPESSSLEELHRAVQTVFGWRDSLEGRFRDPGGDEKGELNPELLIEAVLNMNIKELVYEYGAKWTARIIFLSRNEAPGPKPFRCVAGAGAAPPEFIDGPLKFRRLLAALESGNNTERLAARQELGPEFIPEEFDMDSCNRSLLSRFPLVGCDK